MLKMLYKASSDESLEVNILKTTFIPNLVPNKNIQVTSYVNLGYELKIDSDNQTCKIKYRRRLSWAVVERLCY